jgi:hypothetical protein
VAAKSPRKNILFETSAALRRTGEHMSAMKVTTWSLTPIMQNADGGAEPTLLAAT